jgi:hypothetical protein
MSRPPAGGGEFFGRGGPSDAPLVHVAQICVACALRNDLAMIPFISAFHKKEILPAMRKAGDFLLYA